MKENKAEIRARLSLHRKSIAQSEVNLKSSLINQKLQDWNQFKTAPSIMFYSAINNEVELKESILTAIKQGKKVILPKTNPEKNELDIVEINNYLEDLEPGYLGIKEPRLSQPYLRGKLDLVLVPGIAFDKNGNRVGYGKGYYDHFLKEVKTVKAALAYEFQIVDSIIAGLKDIPVDFIITEERVIDCKTNRKIIDGKRAAIEILVQCRKELEQRSNLGKARLRMSIVLCGNDPASILYTTMKQKKAQEIGIDTELIKFPETISERELLTRINGLNTTSNGIIIQLPLPTHLNREKILESIDSEKDIDGLTSTSLGKVAKGDEIFAPATPKGVIYLLEQYTLDLKGKQVVIISRSNLLGKPLALMLINRGATVTVCHSQTTNLIKHTTAADIIITGVGKANFLTAEMVKEGAVVIDLGIAELEGKVAGDVDFFPVAEKASYITPVPGGVGPVTVAMLILNLVENTENL